MSYEDQHGKAQLALPSYSQRQSADIHGRLVTTGDSHTSRHRGDGKSREAILASRRAALCEYAEWYLPENPLHHSSVLTCAQFYEKSTEGNRIAEARLWSLLHTILSDAEASPQYHPDVIGIRDAQPHRRWFFSHYDFIQDLLQREPVLRRMNLICRWLEESYRSESNSAEARLRGEEAVVLRQLILTHIRGGELYKAIEAATSYGDCGYSCVLSAAQLQTVQEPWLHLTRVVPLFGEYANGQLDHAWTGNDLRLENLSQLFEEACQHSSATGHLRSGGGGSGGGPSGEMIPAASTAATTAASYSEPAAASSALPTGQFDAVIGAALCGDVDVLETAFLLHGSWLDLTWCYLRCALVLAFTKTIISEGQDVRIDRPYAEYVQRMVGAEDRWVPSFCEKMLARLADRLEHTFLPHAALEEQLQMRFILQLLSVDPTREWFDVRPEVGNSEAARLITHTMLVVDTAYNETFLARGVQAYAGDSFAFSMAQYARHLALLQQYPFDSGMRATVGMALKLRLAKHRAQTYASFILSAREYELERQDLNRAQVEEQEAQLVQIFVQQDDHDAQVRREVQHLLNYQIVPDDLLTHNAIAEKIMWQAMHAHTLEELRQVLVAGLDACVEFWLAFAARTAASAELDAITDVSGILTRRVLPPLLAANTDSKEKAAAEDPESDAAVAYGTSGEWLSEQEEHEARFWYALSESRGIAREHAQTGGELAVTRATTATSPAALVGSGAGAVVVAAGGRAGTFSTGADRTLLFQLAQDEAALLQKLISTTRNAVMVGGAVVFRHRACVSAIVWVVKQLCENLTLSLLKAHHVASMQLSLMQSGFEMIALLDAAGYMSPELLPQADAQELFTAVRAMRLMYGRQLHRNHISEMLMKVSEQDGDSRVQGLMAEED